MLRVFVLVFAACLAVSSAELLECGDLFCKIASMNGVGAHDIPVNVDELIIVRLGKSHEMPAGVFTYHKSVPAYTKKDCEYVVKTSGYGQLIFTPRTCDLPREENTGFEANKMLPHTKQAGSGGKDVIIFRNEDKVWAYPKIPADTELQGSLLLFMATTIKHVTVPVKLLIRSGHVIGYEMKKVNVVVDADALKPCRLMDGFRQAWDAAVLSEERKELYRTGICMIQWVSNNARVADLQFFYDEDGYFWFTDPLEINGNMYSYSQQHQCDMSRSLNIEFNEGEESSFSVIRERAQELCKGEIPQIYKAEDARDAVVELPRQSSLEPTHV